MKIPGTNAAPGIFYSCFIVAKLSASWNGNAQRKHNS